MATIGTRIFTWWRGQPVGEDLSGNRYYQDKYMPKAGENSGRRRRWVVYKGLPEASKVPAVWHRWLHYSTEDIPKTQKPDFAWQKLHLPNLTGTKHAYVPQGHVKKGGKRYRVSSDYEPWQP